VVTSVAGAGRASLTATAGQPGDSGVRAVRVGHSWDGDAYEAGRAATAEALDVAEPRLLLVFASFEYDLPRLVAGVNSVSGEVPVIGCSTSGEIGPRPELCNGVVVVCLAGAFQVTTGYATGLHDDPRMVGDSMARALLPMPETRYRFTLMLTDSLAGDQQEMIRGVYGVLGATIPLIGGGAGDNLGMVTSRQFFGDQILQDSVVAASIGTDSPVGFSVRHGWHRQGRAMVVTDSSANSVHSLDDRPALDVWLERHAAPAGIEHDPAAFTTFALSRPLAVARRGDVAVRHVLGTDPQRRSLVCAGSVPMGAAAWFATGDSESTLGSTRTVCADAIGRLDGVPLLALLVFDCAGRRALLGDEGCVTERELIGEQAGDAPLAGFYTYGEIARTRGVQGYHNQTIVAVALS
jgi:hypothetical protein